MSESETPKWQPLNSRQRRVLGTLIEKAKTTPDAYPMTVNALVSGCNQKSNREPQMNLSQEDVEQLLSELRGMGPEHLDEPEGEQREAQRQDDARDPLCDRHVLHQDADP